MPGREAAQSKCCRAWLPHFRGGENRFSSIPSEHGTAASENDGRSEGRERSRPLFWLHAYPISALRPSQVNLGEESHGDQVLCCRSLCGAFSLDLAHLARTAWRASSRRYHVRLPRRARTFAKVREETFVFSHNKPSPARANPSWPGYGSLTLAFCFATRRCMNLVPSFLEPSTPSYKNISQT